MLAGFVLSAIFWGGAGLSVAMLSGHPPLIALLYYSLAGFCGVLLFALQVVSNSPRINHPHL
ncbi:MAG: hypothetical protein R3D63_13045 [Paracoccaceae bacterium]